MTQRAMSAKDRFLRSFEHETATTLKVLQAYPAEKAGLQPHERSNTALNLAWTFVVEQQLLLKALKSEPMFGGGGFPKPPEAWGGVIQAFEKGVGEVKAQLSASSNADLDGSVGFMTGPKQMGEIPLGDFVWFMLHDQIHHRGQLTVYLRMAGGRVPSVYGPTADEPWR